MKNLLLLIFIGFSFCGFSQVNTVMPPEASNFYNKVMPTIKPAIRELIKNNALSLKSRSIDSDSLINALKKNALLKGTNQQGLNAISVLIMVQVSKNADTELKNLVINMRNSTDQPSTASYSETEEILGRKSKVAETIAFAIKKISLQENAINNLK